MTQKLKKSVFINEKDNQFFNIPSESNKEKGIPFNTIFWNIDGLPLNNDYKNNGIQKKGRIESLYKYIDEQNKVRFAILTLIETKIKEKEFNRLNRHVVNPSVNKSEMESSYKLTTNKSLRHQQK